MHEARFATLNDWLAWQETLHHRDIELGLERIRVVARRLLSLPPAYPVITVAGTNGKGSVLAYLQATLQAAGYRTGLYTSPHLLHYNERVQIGGKPASDAELMKAFAEIDEARGDTSLTYFEFGTLAALQIFQHKQVDVGLLEVGMGGRLDAVNIVDPDVSVITNIGLDHQKWLGNDREAIGREKAGIMRARRPVVCGDPAPPASLRAHADEIGATFTRIGEDFMFRRDADCWHFESGDQSIEGLPVPALRGDAQIGNAAVALAALQCLAGRLPLAIGHIRNGLRSIHLAGRVQVLDRTPQWVLDVCHNEASAQVLVDWLSAHLCKGKTRAVLGMLADKNIEATGAILSVHVDEWYLASLAGSRGMTAADLEHRLAGNASAPSKLFPSVALACRKAAEDATPDDRILVCGSFHTVGEALALGL